MKDSADFVVTPPVQCAECHVRRLALFKPLDPEEVSVAETFRSGYRHLKAGSSIFRQGEDIKEVYTLHDGWAFLYQNLVDGGRQILRFILPGDFFGFQADIGNGVRIHSAQTLTAASLCVFPSSNILDMVRDHLDLGIRLIWMTAHDEAVAYEQVVSLGRRTARERIAYLLLDLFHRLRARRQNPNEIHTVEIPLTQELIADACGLTQIHVNRTLKSLRNDRILELKGGRLHVPDLEVLSCEAKQNYNVFTKRPML
ncbi:MAG: Crp/Fnr family transcriptional regulator [Chromatiaceae bacterium]|nr:Crp/Fnr family transcriptional regulator [Chromatiaceae bacterium]